MTIETPQGNEKQQDRELAYAILRLALGVNLFGHAFVRILGGVGAFVSWLAEHMSGTALPACLVRPFGYFLTAEECVVGALLVVGLDTARIVAWKPGDGRPHLGRGPQTGLACRRTPTHLQYCVFPVALFPRIQPLFSGCFSQ